MATPKFTTVGYTVRELFSLSLEKFDGDGDSDRVVLSVTLIRYAPGADVSSVELSFHDTKLTLPPEYLLAAAEFVKSKLP